MEMYSEELFEDYLKNRIERYGRTINTKLSVKRLRAKLERFYHEGYQCDYLIDHAIEVGWRSIFIPPGIEPKPRHLKAHNPELKRMAKQIGNRIPRAPTDAEKQVEADRRREAGRKMYDARRALGLEK